MRSDSPAINAAIRDALDRSATFRQLVATINASDSYVFVNEGKCGHGVRSCFVNVRSAGLHRYLFVRIDSRKTDGELIGSIGHELRHTIEVIGDNTKESNEVFYVDLFGNSSNSLITKNRGIGTILNDD